MKTILSLLLLCGLTLPVLAAEKKTTTKKPATEEKKPEALDKPNGKEQAAADSLTTAQKNKLMKVINDGDDKALNELPGIGETRAAAIKKARPVADVVDLLKIDGIGEGTFLGIVAWAKGEPPPEPKKDEGKTKAKTKKKSS